MDTKMYAVVMAGGRGERFWPRSRRKMPKQFLSLAGGASLTEETVLRLFPLFKPENILVITGADYLEHCREILPLPPENIIGETTGRDTAPCIALAAGELMRRNAAMDAVMTIVPADHLITPAAVFQNQLRRCANFASGKDMLMTIGVTPDRPATGYGYIKSADVIGDGFRKVDSFVEKPDIERAKSFLSFGNYQWNSGIFIWKISVLMEAFKKYAPQLAEFVSNYIEAEDVQAFLEREFPALERIQIDRCIMEKADNTAVSAAEFSWSDLGSWRALYSCMPEGDDGNRGDGVRLMVDSSNNLICSGDNHLVAAIGVNDMAIIHTADATLVCPLSADQRIKEVLARLGETPDGEKFL